MKYSKPNNRLAFRRLFNVELRRSRRSIITLIVAGVVVPLALASWDQGFLFSMGIIAMYPLMNGGQMGLLDRVSGDVRIFQWLPVRGHMYGAARLAVLGIEVAIALVLAAPHLWRPYAASEFGGAGQFILGLLVAGCASWVVASLIAGMVLRFRLERGFAWGFLGFLAFGFGADRFISPYLEPYFGQEQFLQAVGWMTTPLGAAVSLLLAVALGVALVALSMRWLRTGIEGFSWEKQAVRL